MNLLGHFSRVECCFKSDPERLMPGYVYNNCKQLIRAAILEYLKQLSK